MAFRTYPTMFRQGSPSSRPLSPLVAAYTTSLPQGKHMLRSSLADGEHYSLDCALGREALET